MSVEPIRTQASLDLASIAKWPANFTYEALVRLSKANIDAATIIAARGTCACFYVPSQTQAYLTRRLSTLRSVQLYGSIAWFGFGLRHVLQDLADRDHGTNCLAICGTLMESYSAFYSSQVLRRLCTLQGAPDSHVPGTQRWVGLLKTIAGIFRQSQFSLMVEGFSRLFVSTSAHGVAQRGTTDPESLASGLLELGKVSKGQIRDCTFSGGFDCAWLAAVAIFVLDLTIEIRSTDGDLLYKRAPTACFACKDTERARLCNHLAPEQRNEPRRPNAIFIAGSDSLDATEVLARAHTLPSGRNMFRSSILGISAVTEFQSRSSWNSIIQDSFGAAGKGLLDGDLGSHFGMFFAYIVQKADHRYPQNPFEAQTCQYLWPVVGRGSQTLKGEHFLSFTSRTLPELHSCLTAVKYRTLPMISEDAAIEHVQYIQRACGCPACTGIQVESRQFTCLRSLAGTLVLYADILSNALIDPALLPTPYGLRQLYDRCSPRNSQVVGNVPQWKHRWPAGCSDYLRDTFLLFAPSETLQALNSNFKSALALSFDGLCCYYEYLTDPIRTPGEFSRVHVLAGHIAFGEGIYDRIESMKLEEEVWNGFNTPIDLSSVQLWITETLTSNMLHVAYEAHPAMGRGSEGWLFSIGQLIWFSINKGFQGPGTFCDDEIMMLDYRIEDFEENHSDDLSEQSNTSETNRGGPVEYFAEAYWTLYVNNDHGVAQIDTQSCRTKDDVEMEYGLLLIESDAYECNDLNITWYPVFGSAQDYRFLISICAEFGRNYRFPVDRLVHYEIARLPRCMKCILTFVMLIWPERTGPHVSLPEGSINGRFRTWAEDRSISTSNFELRRSTSFDPIKARTCSVNALLDEKSPPPSAPQTTIEHWLSMSIFNRYYKALVSLSSPAERGLEALSQLDLG